MKIGLDFDGVVTDCGKHKSDCAMKIHGICVPPEKFKKKFLFPEGIFTESEYFEFGKIIYGTMEYGLLMEPVDDALVFIPQLITDGHEIIIVTSRKEDGVEVAREWLMRRGLELEFVGVGYGKSKADALIAAGVNFFVDDDLEKLTVLVGLVKYLYLFLWGYNLHEYDNSVVPTVASWSELYEEIQKLNRR